MGGGGWERGGEGGCGDARLGWGLAAGFVWFIGRGEGWGRRGSRLENVGGWGR